MDIQKVYVKQPVRLTEEIVRKYASKIREKKIKFSYASSYPDFWLMTVTESGKIIEGDSVATGHPQLVTKYVYPYDKVISFIAKYIEYQTDPIDLSLMAINYGNFNIDGYIDNKTQKEVCTCKFNPFAVTYLTSHLEEDLSQFTEMMSQADGNYAESLNMKGSVEIPFYKNEILKSINAQADWIEKMNSDKQKREEYINKLKNRVKRIQEQAFKLLGISDEMVIGTKGYSILSQKYNYLADNNRNLYTELCALTGCKGYEVILKLEELVNLEVGKQH